MNYLKCYESIIDNRKLNNLTGYSEKHHITPRSLGGGDEKGNIIKLTAREHFVVHRLLAKIHGGSMWCALAFMSKGSVKSAKGVSVGSRLYEYIKSRDAKYKSDRYKGVNNPFYGKTFTNAQLEKLKGKRKAVSGSNNPNYGISDKNKNWIISNIHSYKPMQKIIDYAVMDRINKAIGIAESINTRGVRFRIKSAELKKLGQYYRGFSIRSNGGDYSGDKNPNYGNGAAISGDKNPMYGKKHKESTKSLISKSAKIKVTCPHCGKVGSRANMARWHFDNCKLKL